MRDLERELDECMEKGRYAVQRAKIAEARCARLQQALERIEKVANEGPTWWDDPSAGVGAIAREALAGPDTPADSQPEETQK